MARFDPDCVIPLKETEADKAVKARLWEASKAELIRFANLYAERAVPGKKYADGQRDAAWAAKAKGYRIGLVRVCGDAIIKADEAAQQRMDAALVKFRGQLGL